MASGDALLSPAATRSLIARFLATPDRSDGPTPRVLENLTPREREMVVLVADGKSDDEIAEEACLSPLTVRTHVQRAKTKMEARSRAQLVAIAYQVGLARPLP